jgi:hypothetical protein
MYVMSLINDFFSGMFFRNMMRDLIGGPVYTKKPDSFTPFFQYKVGRDQPGDFYLYFPKEPFVRQYYNEIFNKLFLFQSFDAVAYLLTVKVWFTIYTKFSYLKGPFGKTYSIIRYF